MISYLNLYYICACVSSLYKMLTSNKIKYIDALFLLSRTPRLVKGLRKSLSFYYDSFEKRLACSVLEHKSPEIEELKIEEHFDKNLIHNLRSGKQPISWLNEEDLPFQVKKSKQIQTGVFDELNNIVLLLRFPNTHDKQMDLLYLFFNSDFSNFGLSKPDDILKTESKSIIGQLIHSTYTELLAQRNAFLEKESKLKADYHLLLEQSRRKLSDREEKLQESREQMLEYGLHIAKEQSQNSGYHIEMSEEAKELIRNYRGSLLYLKDYISDAIERAIDTNPYVLNAVVKLETWHFNQVEQQKLNSKSDANQLPESRYLNAYQWLDRLEQAARIVQSENKKLTGANVGMAMEKSISPAAITDAIKKKQDKINTLCKQYPDRWKLIRREFKPLTNVLHA